LRDVLERDGFDVREEPSGLGLVPLLERWTPDAIVLDKEMVGISGLDLLPYINRRHPGTPVILVTAFGGAEVEAQALRPGAAYYMDRPFRVARLLEMLRAAVPRTARDGRRATIEDRATSSEAADPRALAREIVRAASALGGLLLVADYDGALSVATPRRG